MSGKKRRDGWNLYKRNDRNQWVLHYRDASTAKWREHRIPVEVTTERKAEEYARAWLAERERVENEREAHRQPSSSPTFKAFAERWTSGKLHALYPDQVRTKKTAEADQARLELHVFPVVGEVPIEDFTLDHAESVMAGLPSNFSQGSRRHIAQVMRRVVKLAVYPGKFIKANPIPDGFVPAVRSKKALTFLYPTEDAALLRTTSVPIHLRLLFGFMAREGLRPGEALQLQFRDLNLAIGTVRLDKNKTNDPRTWALSQSVANALKHWRERFRPDSKAEDHVFADEKDCLPDNYSLAEQLREHLKAAGVTRSELFEKSEARMPIRAHDLRATFITINLANGATESWVADRTAIAHRR